MTPTIPGTNTLLLGATGTGKTYSLRTFVDCGITPFIISLEAGIASTLGDIPCPDLHWKHINPGTESWQGLIDSARKINQLSNDALQKLSNLNSQHYTQFIDVLTTCNNFVCDRCGEQFGDVNEWSTDRVLGVDSLTGLSAMSKALTIGAKPVVSQPDWGVAMDNLERFLDTILNSTHCHTVVTAHPEMERDEISGRVMVMVSTLGRKLPPKIPPKFDDVALCVRENRNFRWSTTAPNVDLKARNLSLSDQLPPTFKTIIDGWKKKGGIIVPTETK